MPLENWGKGGLYVRLMLPLFPSSLSYGTPQQDSPKPSIASDMHEVTMEQMSEKLHLIGLELLFYLTFSQEGNWGTGSLRPDSQGVTHPWVQLLE